jgi:hypothetical protein
MRSSPSFLVVSRSEEVSQTSVSAPPEGGTDSRTVMPRRDEVEFNELNIQLKVSYKTLLLVFVLFDVLHKSINVLVDTHFVQSFIN